MQRRNDEVRNRLRTLTRRACVTSTTATSATTPSSERYLKSIRPTPKSPSRFTTFAARPASANGNLPSGWGPPPRSFVALKTPTTTAIPFRCSAESPEHSTSESKSVFYRQSENFRRRDRSCGHRLSGIARRAEHPHKPPSPRHAPNQHRLQAPLSQHPQNSPEDQHRIGS